MKHSDNRSSQLSGSFKDLKTIEIDVYRLTFCRVTLHTT